jgi:AraC-like DNA-binding protein
MSPLQFQNRIRFQEACSLLVARAGDVTGVGHLVGYDSPAQFNRGAARLSWAGLIDRLVPLLPARRHAARRAYLPGSSRGRPAGHEESAIGRSLAKMIHAQCRN